MHSSFRITRECATVNERQIKTNRLYAVSQPVKKNSWLLFPFAGKLPFGLLDNNCATGGAAGGAETLSFDKQLALTSCGLANANLAAAVSAAGLDRVEIYSRKVFVGGLPPDIDEGQYY